MGGGEQETIGGTNLGPSILEQMLRLSTTTRTRQTEVLLSAKL